LRRWEVGPGTAVGVVGLGGLGHLAAKLAHALGAEVTVFTTSARKTDDALALGADHVVVSTDDEAMAAQRNRFSLVLDTASSAHDLHPYLRCLALDGTAEVEVLPSALVRTALDRLERNDVRYRFSLDLSDL